jgi:hypothetical protein
MSWVDGEDSQMSSIYRKAFISKFISLKSVKSLLLRWILQKVERGHHKVVIAAELFYA